VGFWDGSDLKLREVGDDYDGVGGDFDDDDLGGNINGQKSLVDIFSE